MNHHIKKLLIVCFSLYCSAAISADAQFKIPPFTEPVTDLAQMINRPAQNKLNNILSKLYKDGGSQIAILTLPTVGDLSIEQASIKIVEKWQLGTAKLDNGLLIFIVNDKRQIRIEVGQGLEGLMTDATAKRIIDEFMVPFFKSGNPSDGILAGTFEVVKRTHPQLDIEKIFTQSEFAATRGRTHIKKPFSVIELLFFSFILLVLISTRTGRALLFFFLLTGGRGGGGGGFSSRGGGGGFSGGGAQGGW